MALRIGLVFLLWGVGTMARYTEDRWYGTSQMTVGDLPVLGDQMTRLEEVRNEYHPVKQGYGYGGNAFQQDSRDWKRFATVDVRMPRHQDTSKSRGQHGPYGKSRQVNKNSLIVNGYERKKTSRATQYARYDEVASKTSPPTYNSVPVPSGWEQHLLIGCNSNVAKHTGQVGASYGASGASYYPMELMYHDASFSQYDPPYPSPVYHGYEQNPSGYYPPPPPRPADSIPPVPADHSNLLEVTEVVPDTYYHSPSDYYGSPQPAFYPGYEMYPTEYYPSAPHAPPMEGGPAYNTAVDEQVPRFAAPVQEKLMESPKAPVISAFRKPSSPAGSNTTATAGPGKATGNGTMVDQATAASTPNPMPVLTTTSNPNENDDKFWSVESNSESTTEPVEDSTVL